MRKGESIGLRLGWIDGDGQTPRQRKVLGRKEEEVGLDLMPVFL
jgi:hypothetical protein